MSKETKWVIDHPHSEIEFKVKHLMISYVKGQFKSFDATVYTEGNDFSSAKVDLWIDPASIYTGDEKRDEHLRSSEFFDVNAHKEITFASVIVEKARAGEFELLGDLSIKGISKRIKLKDQARR
jgi:polyisoprenoid-binding protein YceI